MIYKSSKYINDFRKFWTIRSFRDSVFNGKITINEADKKQSNVLDVILNFNDKVRPRSKADKKKNINTYESANAFYEVRGLTLNVFKSGIFPLKTTQRKGLQILPPKQMLQRLPISLAQVQAGKENLVNEIRQIIYYLYWAKEISKKIYNNIINSIKI